MSFYVVYVAIWPLFVPLRIGSLEYDLNLIEYIRSYAHLSVNFSYSYVLYSLKGVL